jgi:hypothetical protein
VSGPPPPYADGMAKQKSKKYGATGDQTSVGGTGGPAGKKQRRKVRRNAKGK